MQTMAQYIAEAKRGKDERVSDRALGLELGFAQQTVSEAKAGRASDEFALRLGELLAKRGAIEHAGEVIIAAHAERDHNPRVRRMLRDYLGKIARLTAEKATAASLAALVVLCGALSPSASYVGGEGGIRTHVTA